VRSNGLNPIVGIVMTGVAPAARVLAMKMSDVLLLGSEAEPGVGLAMLGLGLAFDY